MEKKVVELFAGVGGFRLGLDRLNSGWETVWFSQWEPGKTKQWAHDCYEQHFGDCADLNGEFHTGEDISTVDKNMIPDHTLLVGGFPCLTGDTLVMTNCGLKRLDEVEVGDQVLSHDKKYHVVTKFFNQGVKLVYNIQGYAFDNITATGNHRFYVRKKAQYTRVLSDPEWMSVDEMRQCDDALYFGKPMLDTSVMPTWNGLTVAQNQNTTVLKQNLDLSDEALWYLVGAYLGDGWLRKQQKPGKNRYPYNGIILGCNEEKKRKIQSRIGNKFKFTEADEDSTCLKLIFSSVELAAFMRQFGSMAHGKYLPSFVFNMPVYLLKALLDGYFDTDGCINNKHIQYTTVSSRLAYGIADIHEKVYQNACCVYKTQANNTTTIEGRTVNQSDCYIVRCIKDRKRNYTVIEDGYLWYPIRKITDAGQQQVYDIEVQDSHSFVANRAITHNCQDYSVAHTLATSKGIEGKKGVLWWQIRDVLIAKKPAFCIFENVDRLLKSPAKQRGRDFGIILACLAEQGYSAEWRVVNAALYGAAQRRRRTFIFAYRNDTQYGKTVCNKDADLIIRADGFMAKAFPIQSMSPVREVKMSSDIVDVSDHFAFTFGNAGYMFDSMVYTADVTEDEIPPILLGDILEKNVDEKYYITTEKMPKWTYLKGAKKINRTAANGHEYVFSEGPVAFPDPWDRPGRTMLTSESTLNRSTHVVSDPGTGRLRLLTPVEAERLQGFDDNWTDSGMPERMRYFCMGNALVVPMITRMGKVLDEIIEKE